MNPRANYEYVDDISLMHVQYVVIPDESESNSISLLFAVWSQPKQGTVKKIMYE